MRIGSPKTKGLLGVCRAVGVACLSAALATTIPARAQQPAQPPEPPAPADGQHGPDASLSVPTAGGTVAELIAHRRSGVVSAWLENGVRVHHMWFAPPTPLAAEGNRLGQGGADSATAGVIVTITVPGGAPHETAETLGRSMAAAQAWSFPATMSVPAPAMARALRARGVEAKGWAMSDAMVLRLQGTLPRKPSGNLSTEQCCADQLEIALQAASLLLTEPVVSQEAVNAYRLERQANLTEIRSDIRAMVSDQIVGMLLPPGDQRFRFSMEGEVEPDAAATQAWLHRVLGVGPGQSPTPIEVAIVGQVKLDDAVQLAARYLGALPKRARISSSLYRPERFPEVVPAGAVECQRVIRSTDRAGPPPGPATACVAAGFLGPTTVNFREQRALNLGSVALRVRAADALGPMLPARAEAPRAPTQWRAGEPAEPLQVWSLPGGAVPPGVGMVVATVRVRPGDAVAAGAALNEQIARLAAAPMAPAEFEKIKATFVQRLRAVVGEAGYWSEVLAASTYRGYRPDDLAAAEEMVAGFTAEDIHRVWSAYATANRAIGVVIRPE